MIIGYLELLFHFTAEFAPQGDIGKYADDWLEASLGWTGQPGRLLRALIDCQWIEVRSDCRLIVHDWHDHADESVRLKLKRANLPFLTNQSVKAKVSEDSRDMSRPPNPTQPNPTQPEPKPHLTHTNGADGAFYEWFTAQFWPQYWRHTARAAGEKALGKHATSEEARARILSAMLAQKPGYERRDTEKRPYLSTWANQERFNDEPEVFENGTDRKLSHEEERDRIFMSLVEDHIDDKDKQKRLG